MATKKTDFRLTYQQRDLLAQIGRSYKHANGRRGTMTDGLSIALNSYYKDCERGMDKDAID
jgi:hypothetical protein